MLAIRIVAAGAFLLSLPLMTAEGAMAQAATGAAPGKPLQLLQMTNGAGKARTKPQFRTAHRAGRIHVAAAKPHAKHSDADTEIAKAAAVAETPPANAWPAAGPAPTTGAGGNLAMQASPAAVPAPSELVVGGRTVNVVAPDQANAIDLAADAPQAATTPPDTTAAAKPAAATAFVAGAQEEASPVGSASWIAQVLAALGGAVAAGSVAWFLIGSTPQRTYG